MPPCHGTEQHAIACAEPVSGQRERRTSVTLPRQSRPPDEAHADSAVAHHGHETIARLFESHYERVARYIAVRIGNAVEAEDLACEVFLKSLNAIHRFHDHGAPIEAWLYRIAGNLVIDHLRARSRRPPPLPIETARPVASGQDPARTAEQRERLEVVAAAVGGLTPAQREVLSLRVGADLRPDEVAQVMGKSPGAVRELQRVATKRLRSALTAAEA